MENLQTLALSKVVKAAAEKEASAAMMVGEHMVDFTVRVQGSIKKGEAYEANITQKAEPWKLLALALTKLNGVTIDAIVREAEASVLEDDKIDGIKEQAQVAIDRIKGTTKGMCSGKVTTKLVATVL
jgi:hypothetical protein